MDLQFSAYAKSVSGNGSDDFGFFSISGEFSPTPPYNAKLTRSDFGQGGTQMEFSGFRESEAGGIFGTWKGSPGSGDFHIKPSTTGGDTDTSNRIKEAAKKRQVEQLEAMGFPSYLCDKAYDESQGDLSRAIEWITSKLSAGESHLTEGQGEGAEPDETLVGQLTAMGFSVEQAKKALAQNGNNVESSIDWLFAHAAE